MINYVTSNKDKSQSGMKRKSIGKDYISIPFSLIKAQVITEEISRSPQTLSVMEQRKI